MITKAHLFVFSLFFLIIFNLLLSLLLNTSYSYSFSNFNASANKTYAFQYNSTLYNESSTKKSYSIGFITLPNFFNPLINGLIFVEKLFSFGLVPLTPYASINFIISILNTIVIILLIYSLLPFE